MDTNFKVQAKDEASFQKNKGQKMKGELPNKIAMQIKDKQNLDTMYKRG